MRIDFDYQLDESNHPFVVHQIDTDATGVLDMFKALGDGSLSMQESGWGEQAHHPEYPGKTRYEVAIAEMKRKNDKLAISRLGL